MSLPKTIMWKASDGREFIIDTAKEGIRSMEELQAHIAGLRKQYGYDEPTFMHMTTTPEYDHLKEHTISTSELPSDLQQKVEEVIKESLATPDPKKMN